MSDYLYRDKTLNENVGDPEYDNRYLVRKGIIEVGTGTTLGALGGASLGKSLGKIPVIGKPLGRAGIASGAALGAVGTGLYSVPTALLGTKFKDWRLKYNPHGDPEVTYLDNLKAGTLVGTGIGALAGGGLGFTLGGGKLGALGAISGALGGGIYGALGSATVGGGSNYLANLWARKGSDTNNDFRARLSALQSAKNNPVNSSLNYNINSSYDSEGKMSYYNTQHELASQIDMLTQDNYNLKKKIRDYRDTIDGHIDDIAYLQSKIRHMSIDRECQERISNINKLQSHLHYNSINSGLWSGIKNIFKPTGAGVGVRPPDPRLKRVIDIAKNTRRSLGNWKKATVGVGLGAGALGYFAGRGNDDY